jgi:hypothetical protein
MEVIIEKKQGPQVELVELVEGTALTMVERREGRVSEKRDHVVDLYAIVGEPRWLEDKD